MTRLALSLALTVLIGACGDNALPTTVDSGRDTGFFRRDTGRRDTGVAGDAGCLGCRMASGMCAAGITTAACGAGGMACQTCAPGEMCAEGVCQTPPTCGLPACTGCCDAMDACQPGTTEAACGNGGEGCTACPMGATCVAGVCELPCADSCDGCCTPGGTCVDLASTSPAECGAMGAACMACPMGEMCIGGACLTPSCMAMCAGCCAGGACVDPATASQCGDMGSACVDCGAGTCTAGACTFSPASIWNVVILSGTLPDADTMGDPWDPFGGLPDGVVEAQSGPLSPGRTMSQDNTIVPVWNETVLVGVPLATLRSGLTLRVFDSDTFADDPMGECIQLITDAMLGTTFSFVCALNATTMPPRAGWTVRVRIIPG